MKNLMMENLAVTSLEAIEFLNLEGLDEPTKNDVLSYLHCNDSTVQLPWEISQSVDEDSNCTINDNNHTQECYENTYMYSYQYAVNTPGVELEQQHQQPYSMLQHAQYPTNYYSPPAVSMPHSSTNYVYAMPGVPPVDAATNQMYCSPPFLIPIQPVQIVPNNTYYNTVSCVSNNVTNASVYSSNNTNNDPSAAQSPSNTLAGVQNDIHTNNVEVHHQNGLSEFKDDAKSSVQNHTHSVSSNHKHSASSNGLATQNGFASKNELTPSNNGQSPAATVQPARKSWASLLRSPENCDKDKTASVTVLSGQQNGGDIQKSNGTNSCPIKYPKRNHIIDPVSYQLAEYLIEHTVEQKSVSLQPKGLLNKSNYCYINSILQALLACPQVYHLFKGMKSIVSKTTNNQSISTIDRMCQFIQEFSPLTDSNIRNRRHRKDQQISINSGIPFEPFYVHKMLNGKSNSFQIEGRQEDAEEFLGFLLNALNDEMMELIHLIRGESNTPNNVAENDDDKEWQLMGKKKSSITRKAEFAKTPISDIFGGLLKSRVHRNGDQSTDNIQPFFTLQLNIEKVKTVYDALAAFANKIQLEGVTCTKTNKEVEAWQQTMIELLPEVLILHLKCFDYRINGCTKIIKRVEFPIDLKIDAKLLSGRSFPKDKEKHYKLFAVVYHDGKEATKGHYFTDAYHSGYGTWLRYDDAIVKPIQEEQVLKPQGNRVPYLLFYRRCSDRSK